MGRYSTSPTLFEDRQALTIEVLKRLGYIVPGSQVLGGIEWSSGGRVWASLNITCMTTNEGEGVAVLRYEYRGEPITCSIRLITRASNLGRGVYWLFICPETGRACRKLYLSNGRFVSRHAIPGGLYERQTWSKYGRLLDVIFSDSKPPRRMKRHYRGKPTPRYLRHLGKRQRQMSALYGVGSIDRLFTRGKR